VDRDPAGGELEPATTIDQGDVFLHDQAPPHRFYRQETRLTAPIDRRLPGDGALSFLLRPAPGLRCMSCKDPLSCKDP
jgi:hypothetical protein